MGVRRSEQRPRFETRLEAQMTSTFSMAGKTSMMSNMNLHLFTNSKMDVLSDKAVEAENRLQAIKKVRTTLKKIY